MSLCPLGEAGEKWSSYQLNSASSEGPWSRLTFPYLFLHFFIPLLPFPKSAKFLKRIFLKNLYMYLNKCLFFLSFPGLGKGHQLSSHCPKYILLPLPNGRMRPTSYTWERLFINTTMTALENAFLITLLKVIIPSIRGTGFRFLVDFSPMSPQFQKQLFPHRQDSCT